MRIDRDRLLKTLHLTAKLPVSLQVVFKAVPVYNHRGDRDPWSYYEIHITPTQDNGRRKSPAHRIFCRCICGRLIPVGRIHQHKCKKTPGDRRQNASPV